MSGQRRDNRVDHVDVGVSEVVVGTDLVVTVQEQQRRMRHEKGESEMKRNDTHATNSFDMNLSHA